MHNLINVGQGLGVTRLRAGAIAGMVGVLLLAPLGFYYSRDRHDLNGREQSAIEGIKMRAFLAQAMLTQASLVPQAMMMAEQPTSIRASVLSVFQANDVVSVLEVAPAGQSSIYFKRSEPEATTIGAGDLFKRNSKEAIYEWMGRPTISVENESIIATQKIGVRHGSSPSEFWGYIKATVSVVDLAMVLRLNELREQGYSIRLDYFAHDSTAPKPLLSLGGELRDHPIQIMVRLPQDDRVSLRASPPVGWAEPSGGINELILLLAGASIVSIMIYVLLRRSAERDERVELRMLQLVLDKELMEAELERNGEAYRLLQEAYALLDSVFEHIPSMIVLKRVSDLTVVRVNRLGESILGKSNALLYGRSSEELFQGQRGASDAETDKVAIRDGDLIELPVQFIQTPGGLARWIKIKKLALMDGEGRPSHLLELGEDITVHRHLDEALSENLNFVEQLLAAIPSPIFFKDVNGYYMGVNKAFEEFYGTTSAAIVGKTVYDISPPDLAEIYDKFDRDLLKSGGRQSYEARVKCADGQEKDVVFFKAIFSTTHSEVGGIVGVILDVTQQKAAERHILRQNRTLAVVSEANQAILRAKNCQMLILETVQILHHIGGFPLAWGYGCTNDLSTPVSVGVHPELAVTLAASLRADTNGDDGKDGVREAGSCRFFSSLQECEPGLAEVPLAFARHGLVHLPLRVERKIEGGICIVGLAEDLADIEEQRLLAGLAENLTHAIEALEQEHARQIAERKLELAAHVFENSAEGVMITDMDNMILMVNRRFSEITGYTAEEVTGNTPRMLSSGQQDESFYSNMWRALTNRGEWHGEIRNRRKDGEIIVEWMNISAVRDGLGQIINYVAVFSEITVHKTIKKRMQFLAHYDALTSLPNRILFDDRLEQSVIAARLSKRSTVLMLVDLDHLDQINKSVGHSAGDILLQEVSARLLGCVAPGNCVARLGGDEFAIALSDIGSNDEAATVANRLLQELGRAFYIQGVELYISASIGISVFPRDGDDAEALTKSADAAMYLAAEAGGNTYRFPQANESLSDRVMLRDRLQRAIERDELQVFYQPLVSSETGRIVGAEALLRWLRPEAGFVSPESFVPMLEDSGLAVKVGDWVLRTALAANIRWRKDFDGELFVAVNFCADQIADEKAVEKVETVMKALSFESCHLHLEISEGTLMQDAPAGLSLLHGLKNLGVSLTIDNFGTGYSSLSYLNRFPIDAIKIDRTFVQDTPNDAEAVAITRTIVAMGHALNLKIVAAGVETQGQVNFLRQCGCDALQGYRFSRGVSAEEFAALLVENQGAGSSFAERDSFGRLHLVG